MDQEFDRKGLVFDDPAATAYMEEIGKKVIPELAGERELAFPGVAGLATQCVCAAERDHLRP